MSNDRDKCEICTEFFNKTKKSIVECYCGFTACRECWQTYLISQNELKCMDNNCQKSLDRVFLAKYFPMSFINKEYKNHRENILFEQTKQYFGAHQIALDNKAAIPAKVFKETLKERFSFSSCAILNLLCEFLNYCTKHCCNSHVFNSRNNFIFMMFIGNKQ